MGINTFTRPDHGIRRATTAEAGALGRLIALAFDPIPITRWLIPCTLERERITPAYFAMLVKHAAIHGTVETTRDGAAVAVWLPSGEPNLPPIDDYDQRLAEICGAHVERFRALDTAMHAAHPTGLPHEHLMFLAVNPSRQNQGLGAALLSHRHEVLDFQRTPAYLEAASPDAQRLYERHGYTTFDAQFTPAPDCAGSMIPMWRSPRRTTP
ncbi:MAG: GNAT family N-acetyltransferase [Micromonosporaceae bacterium]|nr:GNAT family N-acetyltransferase [Micromonosporaceae bacterium]